MTAKIMKEIESIKVTLATAMASKLDWRLAVAALAGTLIFVYTEIKELRDDLATMQQTLNQILYNTSQNADQQTPVSAPAPSPAASSAVASEINYYTFLVDSDGKTYYLVSSNANSYTNTPITPTTNPTKENTNVPL